MVNAEHGVAGWLSVPAVERADDAGGAARLGGATGWLGRSATSVAAGRGVAAAALRRDRLSRHQITGWMQLRPYWWGILGPHRLGLSRSREPVPGDRRAAGDPERTRRPLRLRGAGGRCRRLRLARPSRGRSSEGSSERTGLSCSRARCSGCCWSVTSATAARGGALRWRCSAMRERSPRRDCCSTRWRGVDRAFTISKIHATLPWGLVSAALTCAAWVAVFVIADVLGQARWPRSISIAGENPLLAYLLAPLLLSLFALAAPALRRHRSVRGARRHDRRRPRPLGRLRLARRSPQRLHALERPPLPAVD